MAFNESNESNEVLLTLVGVSAHPDNPPASDNLPPIDQLEGDSTYHVTTASGDNSQLSEEGDSTHHITPAPSDNCQPIEQSDSAHHITPASDTSEEDSRRYVIGLLASTALKLNHWQATDFVALNALLDCPEENSSWLCGEEIRGYTNSNTLPEWGIERSFNLPNR